MDPSGRGGRLLERVRVLAREGPPQAATSPVHDERVVARVGRWLGIAFGVCFVTGVLSHLHQHPVSWIPLSPTPSWGFRFTQGLHVATGLATIPLLLAKLYAAYPRLLSWPPVKGLVHGLERGSVGVLVASALFQVSTGLTNIFQWYPWGFGFTRVHWAVAWVTIGALVVHVAVHLPTIRRALSTPLGAPPAVPPPTFTDPVATLQLLSGREVASAPAGPVEPDDAAGRTRRGFLVGTGLVVAAVTVTTVGQTVTPLSRVSVLAPRRPLPGPQGLPINRTAAQARVTESAVDPLWSLTLTGPAGTQTFTRAALEAMSLRSATLPIACVEGWSRSAHWEGVALADLMEMAGADRDAQLTVTSLEERGAYRITTLPAPFAHHPDSLLALSLDGEELHVEHGYPARIIAPGRPGVLQTKWVRLLEVVGG